MAFRQSIRDFRHRCQRSILRAVGRELPFDCDVKCGSLRLGTDYGGWTICPENINSKSVVYSFGIGRDVSWDIEMIAKFGVCVHAFDPTPISKSWLATQKLPDKFVYHDYGIGNTNGIVTLHAPMKDGFDSFSYYNHGVGTGIECNVRRLSWIMESLGHSYIDILKMDIEGAEYVVVEDFLKSGVEVRQILIELHHFLPNVGLKRSEECIQRLKSSGYKVFSISPIGREYSLIKD